MVLSHGDSGDIALARDLRYEIMKTTIFPIMTYCPSIKLVPKLIFTQACKGSNHIMIPNGDYCNDLLNMNESGSESSANSFVPVKSSPGLYRLDATFEGDVATRNVLQGSYFIQSLCRMIKKDGYTKSLQDIAMAVKEDVIEELK